MSSHHLLIEPDELIEEIAQGSADLVIVDVRVHYVDGAPRPNVDDYHAGHIPGAVFADLVDAFSDPHDELQFTLPSPERFERAAGALGISNTSRVVIYTDGWQIWATRLWWLFRYFGFDSVRVLNANFSTWRGAGLPVSGEDVRATPAVFVANPRPELVTPEPVVEGISAGTEPGVLVNALPRDLFTGELPTHGDTAGRIPSSVNLPWPAVADLDSGRFEPSQAIATAAAAILPADPQAPVVAYCGAGVSATGLIFGLALAGHDSVRLYDGSLDSWVLDGTRTLARGEDTE